MDFTLHNQILLTVFITAMVMGAVVNKTNFCTMGAVSDWVNIGDKGRLRAWMLAMAVAMGGLLIMEATEIFRFPDDSSQVFPPYRTANFAWLRYVLGGFIFGIGMTLGSGCGNKTLVRIGGGNIKSVVVLIVGATMAYIMLYSIEIFGKEIDFFGQYMLPWISATTIDLVTHGISSQELGTLIGGMAGNESSPNLHLVAGGLAVLGLLGFVLKSDDFRSNFDNILAGLVVGAAVIVGWYITGSVMGQTWMEEAMFLDNPPTRVAVQSFTFISPMGDSARYVMNPTHMEFINFGVMALTGVIAGSFLYALVNKSFRIEWFLNGKDALNHIIGGVFMGFGGVLGMGCTIGQGVTGVSTLALGSILTVLSIIFGCALTMKIQFNMLDEQKFFQALHNSLAEMRLLPAAK